VIEDELRRCAARSEAARTVPCPEVAVAEGVLGFWAALEEVFPRRGSSAAGCTRRPTVLNYLPRAVQPKAKAALHEIWIGETSSNPASRQ